MPFTASQLGEVPARDAAAEVRVFDVELPYRRLGRCRMSDPVALALGTRLDQVAAALTSYEERNGRAATASQLLGSGVDLEAKDGLGDHGRLGRPGRFRTTAASGRRLDQADVVARRVAEGRVDAVGAL